MPHILFRKKSVESIIKHAQESKQASSEQLKKELTVTDLTALGIAAIIGAGIFSTIGNAAFYGGPAVSMLFIFTAIACGFSAMCYARFASSIPISGSAYTYAYASFGELVAWIIGWDLIMEYAVGNIAVAISWSDYFSTMMLGFGIEIPSWLSIDYYTAKQGFLYATEQLAHAVPLNTLSSSVNEAYTAWLNAPCFLGIRIIADIPAFLIVVLITWLVYIGIYETKIANNLMVLLKVSILLMVIAVGAFWVEPENWKPFAPNGITGVLKGVSGVFFAYIGFDAISTTAEECKNPSRDLPRAIIYSLLITTLLYVVISLVLTGMVNYSELSVGDPLAYVFAKLHLTKLSGIIAISAIIALASVLLVFQVGQPRIWMSMSRDGLLPYSFSVLHKKYKTPAFSTLITGVIVAVPSLFMNLTEVTDLTSIGTLFAFVIVSAGVLVIDNKKNSNNTKGFKIPYLNSRYLLPPIILLIIGLLFHFSNYNSIVNHILQKPLLIIYIIILMGIFILSLIYQWSFIPVMGLLTNLYLLTELGITNWLRFLIWLVMGLVIYFSYGIRKSKLQIPQ